MVLSKRQLLKENIVGKKITVIRYQGNSSTNALFGTIIEDTKNTLVVQTNNGRKTLLKNALRFQLEAQDKVIDGKYVSGKLFERIKQAKSRQR